MGLPIDFDLLNLKSDIKKKKTMVFLLYLNYHYTILNQYLN